MEEKIFCKKHLEQYAEKYCEECNEFICPYCALSNTHFSHINKIKSLEEIIKQKIKGINEIKNISLYKTTELFQFIINYNTQCIPFDNSFLINSIIEEFDTLIGKMIELKLQVINLFSKKVELISGVLKSTKNEVLETQHKILDKINENKNDKSNNKNEYLNKINLCLEKIRLNKNKNEAMKFIGEYHNLINECFKNDDDLNNKYNFYQAYKYLNDISFSFKDKIFDKLIKPCFKNALTQIDELVKKLNTEENKDYEKLKSKLNELKIECLPKKEKDILIKNKNENIKKESNNLEKKNELNNIKEENKMQTELKTNKKMEQNAILDKIKKLEENKLQKKENKKETKKDEKIKENIKKEEEKKKDDIKNQKEKNDIKQKLEDKMKKEQNDKNDNLNIVFEPPKIEGGKMTQEELNNLKGDEEEKFLKKVSENDVKDIGSYLIESKMVENTEIEIARNIIDELDEDRLDIQYYEGIKFPEDNDKGELNDNAYLEDEEKKDNKNEIKEKEKEDKKEEKEKEDKKEEKGKEEKKEENIIKEKEDNKNKINNKLEKKLEKDNEKNKDIKGNNFQSVFDIKSSTLKNKEIENKDYNIKKKGSLNLDTWVNIETEPKNDKTDNKNLPKDNRKTFTKDNNIINLFGTTAANKIKQNE